jgi:hypothetical protein
LRNFGVKPPKRGIELRWVTRGSRPKKPSSSCGFARKARGARGTRGTWGLKTKNRNIFSPLFQLATTTKKIYKKFRPDRGWTGWPTGARQWPDGGPDGARPGGGRKDYLRLKEKRYVLCMCHVNHRQHPTCLTPGGCKIFLR